MTLRRLCRRKSARIGKNIIIYHLARNGIGMRVRAHHSKNGMLFSTFYVVISVSCFHRNDLYISTIHECVCGISSKELLPCNILNCLWNELSVSITVVKILAVAQWITCSRYIAYISTSFTGRSIRVRNSVLEKGGPRRIIQTILTEYGIVLFLTGNLT